MLAHLKYLLQVSDKEISIMPLHSGIQTKVTVSAEEKAHVENALKSLKNGMISYSQYAISNGKSKKHIFLIEVLAKSELNKFIHAKMSLDAMRLNWLYDVKASLSSFSLATLLFNPPTSMLHHFHARENLSVRLVGKPAVFKELCSKKMIDQYEEEQSSIFVSKIDSLLLEKEFFAFLMQTLTCFENALNAQVPFGELSLENDDLLFRLICTGETDEQMLLNKIRQLNEQHAIELVLKKTPQVYILHLPVKFAAGIRSLVYASKQQAVAKSTTDICKQLGASLDSLSLSDNNNYVPPEVGHAQPSVEKTEITQKNADFGSADATSFSSNM